MSHDELFVHVPVVSSLIRQSLDRGAHSQAVEGRFKQDFEHRHEDDELSNAESPLPIPQSWKELTNETAR